MKRAWLLFWLAASVVPCFSRTDEKVFKNGLRLVFSDFNRPSAIASAVILIRAGEADGPPYLATLTNRMLLAGTEIRDRQQINQDVESVTGRISTATSLTLSAITVQAPVESFQTCFGILCECATRATFDSIEAVRMAAFPDDDSANNEIFFSRKGIWIDAPLRAKLFFGSPLGADFKKTKPLLFHRGQLESFYRRWYRPENMIVSVAGKVNKADVIKTVQSFWKTGRGGAKENFSLPSKGRLDSTETVKNLDHSSDQVWIGFLAPAFMSSGYAEMFILEMALADGRAGYFSNRVFTEKQDEITVQSYYQSEPGAGYFVLHASAPAGKGQAVKQTILAEIEKIRTHGLPEACFQMGVRKAQSKIAITSQFNLLNASFAAMTAAGGNAVISLIESKNAIGKITPDEINRAARAFFVHPAVLITLSDRR
jgi:predicted Zn-dependent peptidase